LNSQSLDKSFKKGKMKTRSFIGVAVLIMLAGCQKQNNSTDNEKVVKPVVLNSVRNLSAANLNADSIGIIHNNALAAAMQFSSSNKGWNGQVVFLQKYFNVPPDADHQAIVEQARSMMNSNAPVDADQIINRLPVTEAARQLLSAIMADSQQMSKMDPELLIQRLTQIDLQAQHTLNPNEQLIVHRLFSVAKFSAIFWKRYFEQYPLPEDQEPFLKWLAALYADNCGCLVGILFGDPDFGAALFSASVGYVIYYDNKAEG
jgi:phage gp37-like protein